MGGQNKNRGRGFRAGAQRGGGPAFRGRGRAGGKSRGVGGYHTLDEMTEMDSMFFETNNRGTRGRGSGRGSFSSSNTPNRGSDSPRGRGRGQDDGRYQSSPGRGRGRGNGRRGSKLHSNAPLSGLLHQERPYLRPVVFVPSVYTKILFQEEEEILQPVVEEVGEGEQSHVPTADRVFRVFSGGNAPPFSSVSENEQDVSEGLEEIDFNDMEKLLDLPDVPVSQSNADVSAMEEKFTGFYIDTNRAPRPESAATPTLDIPTPIIQGRDAGPVSSNRNTPKTLIAGLPTTEIPAISQEEPAGFYIDTEPCDLPIDSVQHASVSPITHPSVPMGSRQLEDDEDIIVYVAPHPRSGKIIPAPAPAPILSSTSILTGTTRTRSSLIPASTPPPAPGPSLTPTSGSIISGVDNLSLSANIHTLSPTTQTPAPSLTRVPSPPPFSSVSFSPVPSTSTQRHRQRKYDSPVSTVRSRTKAQTKLRIQEARAARKRVERQQQQKSMFGSFGAIMEEAALRRDRDPRWEERRRGDSDVEWGDEDGAGEEGGGGVIDGDGKGKGKGKDDDERGMAEGMDLDPELELDGDAMRNFVRSMGADGQNFVTMDDIADGEMMRREDEEDEEDASSDEEDQSDEEEMNLVVDAEEELLIAEGPAAIPGEEEDESEDDDDDDDEDDESQSPRTGFQARLERLRNHSRGKYARDASLEGEDDEDDPFQRNLSWAEEDEDLIAHIQSILDENEAVLTGRDRKQKNKLFRAVQNGAFEDIEDFHPAGKRKDKYKDIPEHLRAQWQKDRDQKAEYKRQRALTRLVLASDPLSQKKGGKKGRKAMLAASKLDPTITVLPNRIIDMMTLVQQIRRFLADIGGPSTMSLPPTDKETRKNVHEMAVAFGLKSQSKGKGDARYTTLIKTSRSAVNIDEKKVAKIVRKGARGGGGGEFSAPGGRKGGRTTVPKHKEGDEVGKAAPKIGESNIGFRMLASMGWSEGDRIGLTGGLDAPLTAVIKHTKLGLGATK